MLTLLVYSLFALGAFWFFGRLTRPISRVAAMVLIIVPLLFTGGAILTGRVLAPVDLAYQTAPLKGIRQQSGISGVHHGALGDVAYQEIPWRYVTRQAIFRGEWPLWNPYSLNGDILVAGSQPAPYHPINIASYALPFAASLNFHATAVLFLAALSAFLWLRQFSRSPWAALIGATGWMASNYLIFWLEYPLTITAAVLPLVLLGILRIFEEPSLRSASLLYTGFVLLLLAGHPETALHVVLIGLIYAAWQTVMLLRTTTVRIPKQLATIAGFGLGAGVLSLLTCAIFLLPTIEALPQSFEHFFRQTWYASQPRGVEVEHVLERLKINVVPFVFGLGQSELANVQPDLPLAANGYGGSLLFAPAIYALWRSRWPDKWLMAALAVLGWLFDAKMPGLDDTLSKLPLFDIAINERLLFASSLAIAALAAAGVDAWIEAPGKWQLSYVHGVVLALLALMMAVWWKPMRDSGLSEHFLTMRIGFELVPIAAAALLPFLPQIRLNSATALLILLAVQRLLEAGDVYPALPIRSMYPRIPLLESLEKIDEPFRIVGHQYHFIPNMSAMYGLEDPRGYQAMTNMRLYSTFDLWCFPQPVWFNRVADLTRPFLSFLNVRFAITDGEAPVPPGWTEYGRGEGFKLLENGRVLPRAFVPRSVRIGVKPENEPSEMLNHHDFREMSWIGAAPGDAVTMTNGPGQVRVRRRAMARFDLDVSMESSGWVVVSETAWKGWHAFSGEKELPLVSANHAFLGFYLMAGHHEVTLLYRPRSFVIGAWLSFGTILTVVAVGSARRKRLQRL